MNTGLYMGRSENEGELEVTGEAELERYLRELEEKLLKPEIRTSSEEISKLLADEFFEIGSNEDKKQHTLRSSIWKYRNGAWKMYFHQGTPVHV